MNNQYLQRQFCPSIQAGRPVLRSAKVLLVTLPLLLAACTTLPVGPSVMVLPGKNQSFEQFRSADAECRQYAASAIGNSTEDNALSSGAKSAAVGAVVGAVAGALTGDTRHSTAAGAGIGVVGGVLNGIGTSEYSQSGTQKVYDNAFIQCMYGKGHQVPVYGRLVDNGGSQNTSGVRTSILSGKTTANRPEPPEGMPPPPPTSR